MSQFPPTGNPAQSSPTGSGQLVLIGFVIALVAVILMNVYVEMRVAASQEDTVTFFRFPEEKGAGDKIDISELQPIQVQAKYSGAFGTSAVRENDLKPGTPLDGDGQILTKNVAANQILSYDLWGTSTTRVARDPGDEGLDEITLNIDSKKQPANLRPGDYVDIFASIPLNRDSEYMRVMEYVKVVNLGDRVQEAGTSNRNNKYGSITIYIDPKLTTKLFDIQKRVAGQTFNVTRRDPLDKKIRKLDTGGSREINKRVLELLNLD